MLISDEIKAFLQANTYPDLADLYHKGMEVQVIVKKGDGQKIESDFKGRSGNSYTNGLTTWYPIRVPRNANSDPIDNDIELRYNLSTYALGIGLTGWNWIEKKSIYIAYDLDSIIGHSERHQKKLTNDELKGIEDILEDIDYVTIRRSTSGNGRHIYVFVNKNNINNHTEHAALARYILGKLSSECGKDLSASVDTCGGNIWIYHEKMKGTNGLQLIKRGGVLNNIPDDWKQHIPVINGRRKKAIPFFVNEKLLDNPETEETERENEFLELTGQRVKIPFDKEHKRLIKYLVDNGYHCSYNQDLHLITLHTYALKQAHKDLQLRGVFDTVAQGREQNDLNSYAFPLKNGAWAVKRFSAGVAESACWFQDQNGYTSCYYNKEPDLRTASITYGGIENTKSGFVFNSVNEAQEAALMLGVDLAIPKWADSKKVLLKKHMDGRLLVQIEHDPNNDSRHGGLPGWYIDQKFWNKLFNTKFDSPTETEMGDFDNLIRHLISPLDHDAGWAVNSNGKVWQIEPIKHIELSLRALGYDDKKVKPILGNCVLKSWKLVNLPFQPEYPGNRQWNKNATQLKYTPLKNTENLHYPTWLRFLNHLGKSLDEPLKSNEWAIENNILTGADYLKCWIASVFQFPQEPLPYLFFYSPEQRTGKSSFHIALSLLMTGGVQVANVAIESQSNFNGELENAVICAIEEINLKKDKKAFNKIKDWVKAPKITIRRMRTDAYDMPNYTHWCHTSNDAHAAPLFTGDTIITAIHVGPIPDEEFIEKKEFYRLLDKEAQDFITEVMSLEIPPCNDRLNVPVVTTEEKIQLQESNMNALEAFIKDYIVSIDGESIKFSEFYKRFLTYIDDEYPNEYGLWSDKRVGREVQLLYPKGRSISDNQVSVCNVAWKDSYHPNGHKKNRLIVKEGKIIVTNG